MAENLWSVESAPALRALDAGQSPVLVSGLGAAARAHFAASARRALGAPLVVVCADDTAAETMRRDLETLLGEPALVLRSRDCEGRLTWMSCTPDSEIARRPSVKWGCKVG